MELIDYVTNTPQNTNKTILRQLVKDEKNKAVYESVEELKENGSIGYGKTEVINCAFPAAEDGEFSVGGVNFAHVSDLMPTKKQMESGKIQVLSIAGDDSRAVDLQISEVLFDDEKVYGGAISFIDDPLYFAVAYQTGEWQGFTIPKTGFYLCTGVLSPEWAGFVSYRFFVEYDNIHTIDGKYLPTGTPWIEEGDIVEVLPEITLTVDEDEGTASYPGLLDINVGEVCIITYNGIEYECETQAVKIERVEFLALGNSGFIFEGEPTGNCPFAIFIMSAEQVESLGAGAAMFILDGSTSVTIRIQKSEIIPHMIDERCFNISALGIPTNIKNATARGAIRTISSREEDDEYWLGHAAFAEGIRTTASGECSHAEGSHTTASGISSHAEGSYTTASGTSSHAEGSYTTASGHNSHAEGNSTTASGNYSHTEGANTTASGEYSHAEGHMTSASGVSQHVQGRYNVEDTKGKYAHIVGNGDIYACSNAHTLDWDGNAWFAGGIELTSPNGTRYRFTVADDGTLSAAVVS